MHKVERSKKSTKSAANVLKVVPTEAEKATATAWGDMTYEQRLIAAVGPHPNQVHEHVKAIMWCAMETLERGSDDAEHSQIVTALLLAHWLEDAAYEEMARRVDEAKADTAGAS